MAKNSMDLLELLRKLGMDGNVDFLREALQVLVEGIMPSLLEPRRRREKALLSVVQQAYVEGVQPIKSLGCDGISKSQVSRICRDLDQVVINDNKGAC